VLAVVAHVVPLSGTAHPGAILGNMTLRKKNTDMTEAFDGQRARKGVDDFQILETVDGYTLVL
jgi:hypothetical protein